MKIDRTNQKYHLRVLLSEVIGLLRVEIGHWYIDATAGGGGHTREILAAGGKVLGVDQDPDAIQQLEAEFSTQIEEKQLVLVKSNFANLSTIVKDKEIKMVKGVLLDLGTSTYQIKHSGRGFSFRTNEPLDMRMSATGMTAANIINSYSKEQLYDLIRKYGEEQAADRIAEAIVRIRALDQIRTTSQLATIIREAVKRQGKEIDPATKTFQALRIEVNQELNVLKQVMPQIVEMLEKNGRGIIISFHSLEDRVVKQFISSNEGVLKNLTKRPVRPTDEEIAINRAARSAKLRAFEKI